MRDKKGVLVLCLFLGLIISLSLVSAGFFDFWKKVTEKPIQYSPGELGKLEAKGVELERVARETKRGATCTDTDGGLNYYVWETQLS